YIGASRTNIVVDIGTNEYIVRTCTFTNCLSGAIGIELSNGGKTSIVNSQFTGCYINNYGGAINADIQSGGSGGGIIAYIIGENSQLVIGDGVRFDTCSSFSGGGLDADIRTGAQLIFEGNCQFKDCSTNGTFGGGMRVFCYDEGSFIRADGELIFNNCSSVWSGGGAFIDIEDNSSVIINKVQCVDCKGNQGAGLNIQPGLNAYFAITEQASFTRCESAGIGGGICFSVNGDNAEIRITGEMEFTDCIGMYGGGISIWASNKIIIIVISNACTFQNCTGTQLGGGIYLSSSNIDSDIQFTGELSFDNCSSVILGGGMYLTISGSQLSFENIIQVKDCSSENNGGGLYVSCSNEGTIRFIEELNFDNCSSQNQGGGAIYASIQSGGILTIDGQCRFTECTAQNNGGGIFAQIDGQNTKLIISDGAIFETCSSQGFGGGLGAKMNNGAQLIFQGDCQFNDCSTNGSGGGLDISATNEGGLIKCIGELIFNNCSSVGSGGGGSLSSGDKASIEINKVTCIDCKSGQGAGLNIYSSSNTYFSISGKASFTRCESSWGGGGILFSNQGNTEIQLTGEMKFIDCIGNRGGGVYFQNAPQIQLIMPNKVIFQNCTGTYGGGMYMYLSDISINIQITGELSFDNCSSSYQGGGLYLSTSGSQLSFVNKIQFKDCSAQQSGGGIYLLCSGAESNIQINGDLVFDNCKVEIAGGGLYMNIISGGSIILDNKCDFLKCKSGNGGAMYLRIDFVQQSSFQIKDILIQECKALINTESAIYSQSGFGGGIFIAGTGDYDVASKMLDFSKMKMYGNTADKAGQSLYVVMPNVIQWCRIGNAGECVKGNYSDIDSDESELEGIPVGYSKFNGFFQVDIIKDQRPLELWWRTIWHILNRNEGIIKGNNQNECAEFDNPCYSIDYALQQISVELGETSYSVIPEKRIGICEAGYDLTAPYQFSKTSSYTNIVKIMKQLYLTKYNMEGKAEIKIIKGGDASNIENGHKGWISVIEEIELKFYFIKFVTDKSILNIPIIYIEDGNTNLELDSVTFSDINLSPTDEPKGIIHIEVNNTELIISDCIFEDISIEGEGGSAIRIENDQENSFTTTIEGTQFNNINSTGSESGQGGSAIYAEIREDCSLIIDDNCEFNDCVIESGNGGALYIDIDYSKNFQFKIKDATFRRCKALKHSSKDVPPSGYGGVIFLTGTGDYDVESEQIDLGGMKSNSNSADNGGNNIYIVMPQLEDFCKYDEGSLVKGDNDDKESDINDVKGIATNISTFIQFAPEQIEQEQKSLQYFWAIIASLRTAKVVVDFRNVDEPFKYQLVGMNMKQGNLNEANEIIWPLDETTNPINIVDQLDEQLATFAMKDKQFLNYKQKQYGALISNDRRFFTGSDGIEGRTVLLEVEVVFDTEEEEEELPDPPQKSKFAWWIGLLIGLVVLAIIITIGCCFICYCCLWKKKKKDKDLDERLKKKEF
ncbi:MAG: hypothetical protein EZS28_018036, partial [Streblomastix strix]